MTNINTGLRRKTALFRFKADRLPVAVFTALLIADLCVFAFVSSWPLVLAWSLLTVLPKVCICSWNHHHQHVPFFRSAIANRMIEVVFALQTGAVSKVWVLHHNIGHHANYMDQTKDESAWRASDGRVMGANEYTLKLAATGYWCAFKNSIAHPKIQQIFIAMSLLHISIVAALVFINPLNALLVFIIPMAIGYLMTCRHTFDHHSGCSEEDEYAASNNIMHKWYNIFTGNLGYHTAHHLRPGLHWSKLPAFHATIAHKIPDANFLPPGYPVGFLPEK